MTDLKEITKTYIDKYYDNPLLWIEKVLRVHLWSKQREIVESVFNSRRTTVRACHSSGKTFEAACAVLAFIFLRPPAKIVTTGPSWYQVRFLLWSEINHLFKIKLQPLGFPGEVFQTMLSLAEHWFAVGISPKEDVNFQGFHQKNVLVVFDEAPGVREEIAESADSLLASGNAHLLKIGNPTKSSGHFYNDFRDPSVKTFHISAFDTPNYTGETVPESLRNQLINEEWVNDKKVRWGEDSPLYISRVLADFPHDADERQLISLALCEDAVNRDIEPTGEKEMGLDIARFGGDLTCYAIKQGRVTSKLLFDSKRDTMEVAGRAKRIYEDEGIVRIKADVIGVGCFDEETEILTKNGFKKFELLQNEKVLTMNPETRKAFYVTPSNYFKYYYEGLMYTWEGQTLNFCVTPNHNFFYRGVNSKQWQFNAIQDIDINEINMLRSFKWEGENRKYYTIPSYSMPMPYGGYRVRKGHRIPMNIWLKFLAWCLSEGFAYRRNNSYFVVITQKKDKWKIDRIRQLLSDIPFKYHEKMSSNGEVIFEIASKQLYNEISKCGKYAPNKFVPSYLKKLSVKHIKAFLDEYLLGDGYTHKGMRCYTTSSPKMADDLQELILKTGNYASVSITSTKGTTVEIENRIIIRTSDQYTINEWKSPVDIHFRIQNLVPILFHGYVYDIEVRPFHLIYVRRKGKCFWSGNSGVVDRLNEQGINIIGVNSAENSIEPDRYFNKRTEMWFNAMEWLKTGKIPDDDLLIRDLTAVKFEYTSKGQYKLELKDQTKKRLGYSPDRGDAFVLAIHHEIEKIHEAKAESISYSADDLIEKMGIEV